MGFLSDLGKKTSETAGKISKETKLKMKINENKGKIEDLYETIGKKVYEKHVKENDVCKKEELDNECEQIDSLTKEIEEARIEILKLNNKKLCSKCSAEIENGAQFCPKCGEKQNIEEPATQEKAEEAPEKKEEAEAVQEESEEAKTEETTTEEPKSE